MDVVGSASQSPLLWCLFATFQPNGRPHGLHKLKAQGCGIGGDRKSFQAVSTLVSNLAVHWTSPHLFALPSIFKHCSSLRHNLTCSYLPLLRAPRNANPCITDYPCSGFCDRHKQCSINSFSALDLQLLTSSQCPICDVPATQSCSDCEQELCSTHLYPCSDCGAQLCSDCLDLHHDGGHWTDSDTSAEFARTYSIAFDSIQSHSQDSPSPICTQRYRQSLTRFLHAIQSQLALLFPRLNLAFSGASL